jgi:putative transposase
VSFIEAHKQRWGVEPICRAVQFAPATYYAARCRPLSARAVSDEQLKPEISRVFDENYRAYGAEKVWRQLNREGFGVARCTTERLMRDLGLVGARRGRGWKKTTITDELLERPRDLVDRQFQAEGPNQLWVADLTYVKTHSGWVYVAFVIDVFSRRIVGWQASTSLRSDLALDALEMAVYARREQNLDGLIHHSDRGVHYLSIRYTERLADAGVVGSRGDSYDNALAESFNGLYKTELIHRRGPWKNVEDVEWATLTYVEWFNNRRLHGAIGMIPPAEFEDRYATPTCSVGEAPIQIERTQTIESL